MGMFDFVDFEMLCPTCGAVIKGFQSKDGPCELLKIPVGRVDTLYSVCTACETRVRFERVYTEGPLPGFEMEVTLPKE